MAQRGQELRARDQGTGAGKQRLVRDERSHYPSAVGQKERNEPLPKLAVPLAGGCPVTAAAHGSAPLSCPRSSAEGSACTRTCPHTWAVLPGHLHTP